ncbi:hypothetical protein F7R20_28215 [Pseudomonas brassicacearum subsp. brassicacearum]|nr:hypothetical protein F7R20_28215 [Pseudomonas brassicacearum subsp. brassicacearum]
MPDTADPFFQLEGECHGYLLLSRTHCGEGIHVGAKLARETGALISERSHRPHRGQALLPHKSSHHK